MQVDIDTTRASTVTGLSLFSRRSTFMVFASVNCTENKAIAVMLAASLLSALIGIGLLTIGILYKIYYTDIVSSNQESIVMSILALTGGSLLFLAAFFGCYGAIAGSSRLLTVYGFLLILLFIIHIVTTLLAFKAIKDEKIRKEVIDKRFTQLYDNYFLKINDKAIVNVLQQFHKCCGKNGPKDWKSDQLIPESCYRKGKLYDDGCLDKYIKSLSMFLKITGYLSIAIAGLEITGAIMSLIIARGIKNKNRIVR